MDSPNTTRIWILSKIFPIQNSAACVYKWGWNTFRAYNGKSSSCHRVDAEFVPIDEFETFHNRPLVLKDRQLMLQGQWPGRGCEYCQDVEESGGISDRLFYNTVPDLTPIDYDQVHTTPTVSEIYLHNTCDLACVYCIPEFSSRINQELSKHGPNVYGLSAIAVHTDSDVYFDAYVQWLKEHSSSLKRLNIQGGEPLLQKNLWKLLEVLSQLYNPKLQLSINSNLNSNLSEVQRFIETAKDLIKHRKLERLDIQCSIDCWGPQQQFIRYGLNLEQWQQNFEYIIRQRWLVINTQPTITSLSIATMHVLNSILAEYKKLNPRIAQNYHIVDGRAAEVFHPSIFGSFFAEPLQKLHDNIDVNTQTDHDQKLKLSGIVKMLENSTADRSRLKKLQLTLDQLQQRRNIDWRLLFPEIAQYFVTHEIN